MHNQSRQTDKIRAYVQPMCKLVLLNTRHHILAASYGENNQAGGAFRSDNTNDYDDSLL